MARSGNNVVVHVLVAMVVLWDGAAAGAAALPLPDLETTTTMNDTVTGSLSADFHLESCPDLHSMVRSAVQAARNQDVQITAGLLRIFFHDCFPQGCDASLLLDKTHPGSEQHVHPQNAGLNHKALQLIESIRDMVHRRCGERSVSCADILAVATSHAVNLAGGPFINMQLGHRDSVDPAQPWQVQTLPAPTADVTTLFNSFAGKGFVNAIDVVALSGAHTVGKARCSSFSDRTNNPNDDGFARELAAFCAGDGNRQHNLDVITPDSFDNRYFADLINRKGVLTSDQALTNDGRTAWIVNVFAHDQANFFQKFAQAMEKMSRLTSPGGVKARRNCFKRDAGVNIQTTVAAAGSGDDESQLAASA
ncbi:hypothetical protein BDA96_06G302200 [Sorghum bicolor]|uniref:Peroxidase n=2 Tax=Sorghum bicolor TaxID=4558 RepID=A0A921UEM1_SORBI|nr:peroxidase 2 isoform X2 [Sorghum bicolor]EES13152.1 hypothetical protein SORBI_3006G277700 [Sorghum bicolor]KAG0528250.1 hypothetical protein BDA96_06G302200 [Sorghum bicolor]|eukprot:XP_002448824.1 peroxidase 2 isoform X2 [Sorghum bicolor]